MGQKTKRITVAVILLCLFGGLLGFAAAGTANAQPTTGDRAADSGAAIGAADVGVQACVWAPKRGVGGVNVRSRPHQESTRIGIMYEGQAAFGACGFTIGAYYRACGAPLAQGWAHIYWGNTHGYVAGTCVDEVS